CVVGCPVSMAFQLPSGWYETTITSILDDPVLHHVLGEPSAATAWKYVLAAVLWQEERSGTKYLHLNDRLKSQAGKELAKRGEEFLKKQFAPVPSDLIDRVGKAYADERVKQGNKPD